jgi:ketosteroid isomerase-like protein
MSKARTFASIAVMCAAASLMIGCGRNYTHHHVITAKVIDTIKAGEVRWNEDLKSGAPDKVLAHYAADAVVIMPGRAPVVGASALHAMVAAELQDPHFRLSFMSDHVEVPRSGEFAVVKGAYSLTASQPGAQPPRTEQGAYVALYRPGPDHRWLVSWMMTAPGPAEAAQTPPQTPP